MCFQNLRLVQISEMFERKNRFINTHIIFFGLMKKYNGVFSNNN